jgi:hypothetical protein
MKSLLSYPLLLSTWALARLFFRFNVRWLGEEPEDPWSDVRLVVILHHTSLFEALFVGVTPPRFLWRLARAGVVPMARKTWQRPLTGRVLRAIVRHPVSVTRERDRTWEAFLREAQDPGRLVVIFPEGRMMRPSGLDSQGEPMTVRGGIADLLERISEGRMLLVYSGGLHHVQAPGETVPRLFRKVSLTLEMEEIAAFRERMTESAGEENFKPAVISELTRRRDLHCPAPRTGGDPVRE